MKTGWLATATLILTACLAESADDGGQALAQTRRLLETGAEPLRLVCFGDSITGVYYHTGGHRAWCGMLGIALERLYPDADVQLVNAGKSGNTTGAGIARLERDVLSKKPHLVVVMFGMNDMAFDASGKTAAQLAAHRAGFRANLRTIVDQCRGVGAEVILCTPNSIYPDAGVRRPVARLAEYADAVRAAASAASVPLVDCYAAYEEVRSRDPQQWMLMMSETIHPNLNGHKLFAERIAELISGRSVSLADVRPSTPYLPHAKAMIAAGKPLRVVVMQPYAQQVASALESIKPGIVRELIPWETEGRSLAELERWGRGVRKRDPDLVVVAVPPGTGADLDVEPFIRTYSWIVCWSLAFGRATWDVVGVAPSVSRLEGDAGAGGGRDELAPRIVLSHDVMCIERAEGDRSAAGEILQKWLRQQLLEGGPGMDAAPAAAPE